MILKVVLKFSSEKKSEVMELSVGESITLGRSSKADRKLSDEQLSSCHCKFELKASSLIVEDLDSKNGTYLNRIRIEKSEMFMGDEIRIGKTKISYDPTKMDEFSRQALAFPGGTKERVNKELKVDFTGARIQNQLTAIHNTTVINRNIMNLQKKEIESRKKASSIIKISKQQIKSQHKIRASFASLFDLAAVMCILAVPVIMYNSIVSNGGIDFPGLTVGVQVIKEQKLLFMGGGAAILVSLFFFYNFKISKFSLGEKITGIQKKYKKQ